MKVDENIRGATCISDAVFGCVSYVLYVTCHELPMAASIMSMWFGATVVAGAEWKSQKSAPCKGDKVHNIHQNLRRGAQHWLQPKKCQDKERKRRVGHPRWIPNSDGVASPQPIRTSANIPSLTLQTANWIDQTDQILSSSLSKFPVGLIELVSPTFNLLQLH